MYHSYEIPKCIFNLSGIHETNNIIKRPINPYKISERMKLGIPMPLHNLSINIHSKPIL